MIIGLVGFIGAGKTTVANILHKEHNFHKLAFSDTLKDVVSSIFGWDRELLSGDSVESREYRETPDASWSLAFGYPVTPRLMLQKVGTEGLRDVIHQNIWVVSLQRRLLNYEDGDNLVIHDVRFPNEIAMLKKLGASIVRVERYFPPFYDVILQDIEDEVNNKNNAMIWRKMNDLYPFIHPSEYLWVSTKPDYTIYNGSDNMGTLSNSVDFAIKYIDNLFRLK